eukprot:m.71524 g.71524  ORF g.71524 m.71524 type:complete len:88 (-) comp24360_c0_seq1:109-372(-)
MCSMAIDFAKCQIKLESNLGSFLQIVSSCETYPTSKVCFNKTHKTKKQEKTSEKKHKNKKPKKYKMLFEEFASSSHTRHTPFNDEHA